MIVVYDGSFEGFLTLVYDVYHSKICPEQIIKEEPKTLLLDEYFCIDNDEEKFEKVYQSLTNHFSKENMQTIFNMFFCDTSSFEKELLEFIKLGFKNQKELDNINIPEIFKIKNLEKELLRNAHRMYGFMRFQELADGTLYGKLESKFNLLTFMGRHFFQRLSNQNFIIHDAERKLAIVKNTTQISVEQVAKFDTPVLSSDEKKFSDLWRQFFKSVAIEERRNLKLQQDLVPLIYRKYMNEFIAF